MDATKDEMEVERVGKANKYFHKECYIKYLEDKAFKEQERQELDKLVEVIKEIYGVKVIPNSAYPFLQDLRNGTKFFGRYDYSYKKGYRYNLIAETFHYCSETIHYWNLHKSFNGFMGAFRYGLAIVCDKLSIVEQRKRDREMREAISTRREETQNNLNEELAFVDRVKKKDEMDISDLL